jgi:ABC transporter substrate binding protein
MIEWRFAEGKSERYPLLAAEPIHIGVEAIVTNSGDGPVLAAMKATKTIPIIFETGSDPVARGFVTSLAHPGGNLTGVSWMAHELGGIRNIRESADSDLQTGELEWRFDYLRPRLCSYRRTFGSPGR